jgi:hypothetical protein
MKIADRRADNKNANRGTARGREAVAKPLQKYGTDGPFTSTGTGESSAATKRSSRYQKQELKMSSSFGRTDRNLQQSSGLAVADNRTLATGLLRTRD